MRCVLVAAAAMLLAAPALAEPSAVVAKRYPDLPVPQAAAVTAPGADVAAEYAAFSGVWSGRWDGILESMLIVEEVAADGTATGIYIYGDSPRWGFQAGAFEWRSEIRNGILSFGDQSRFEFEIAGPGEMEGRRYRSHQLANRIDLTKE